MNRKAFFSLFLLLFLLLFGASAEEQSGEEKGLVYIIPIQGEINRPLTVFIRRGIQKAKQADANTVIFEIDTFGGLVESALQIATLIGSLDDRRTIAYIPAVPESTGVSWSAGALISFACRQIYMAPGTSIGAAAPVFAGSGGTQEAPEKTVSAVRTQMASLAEKNGYSKAVALAMVDADVELLWIQLGEEKRIISSTELEAVKREAEENGIEYVRLKTVSPRGKLLSLTAAEMLEYGQSSGNPKNRMALIERIKSDPEQIRTISESPADRMVALITAGSFSALLILIGLGSLYLEISSPGFGLMGTVAIITFSVLFAANALLGYVGSLEIILFLIGLVLLLVEIFIIPGFGVAGISGVLCISASLILSQQDFIFPEFQWQREVLLENLLSIGIGLIGSLLCITIIFTFFRRLPLFRRLVLEENQDSKAGFQVQAETEEMPGMGETGITVTTLRPSGKARFGGKNIAVVSNGEFIEIDTKVEVTAISGNRVEVRRSHDR